MHTSETPAVKDTFVDAALTSQILLMPVVAVVGLMLVFRVRVAARRVRRRRRLRARMVHVERRRRRRPRLPV